MAVTARRVLARTFLASLLVSVTFPLAEMVGYAIVDGLEHTLKPVRQIAAVALGERALGDEPSLLAVLVLGGVILNVAFNFVFCLPFVALAHRHGSAVFSARRLVLAGCAYGAVLWPLNFYVLAPLIGWDFFPDLHHPVVEAVAHISVLRLPLGLYLASTVRGTPMA